MTHSDWRAPVIPVVKKSGAVRLCADYSVSINKFLKDEHHPIPNIESILAKMSGGKYFCTLDINQAYLHMEMEDESSRLLAISTTKGVYRVKRLMFGVKVAPVNGKRLWMTF